MRPGYHVIRTGRLWAAHHDHFGILSDDCECEAQAEAVCDEHAAEAEEARIADAVADFLHALDRGDFGDALRLGPPGDRAESAYVTALRRSVEASADRTLVAEAHRPGAVTPAFDTGGQSP